MKLSVIDTGNFKLDGGAMFGVVPKTLWNPLNPADENNMCTWAMRCLLIEDNNTLTLIDTGIGNKQDEKFFRNYYLHGSGSLMSSLKAEGYQASDIQNVFLTHLHFDHCGGAITANASTGTLEPAFANAQYISNKAHWHWAVEPNPREKASFLKENILPIQESGQLIFTDQLPEQNPLPGIVEIIQADGHTEKMMLPLISYKGRKILYCADLFPSSHHIPLPWVMAYDMRPLMTLEEKEVILNRAIKEDWILFFEHDPIIECATLQETPKGIRVKETLKLSDL